MTIGIAGPVDISLLDFKVGDQIIPKKIKSFPLMSYLANAFLKRGHKVIFYSYAWGIEKPVILKDENVTICLVKRENHAVRNFYATQRKNLLELIKQYPADIISAQWSYEFAWAALDSKIPTVITLRDHALTIFKFNPDPNRFIKLLTNYIVLKKTKYLTAKSSYLLKKINSKKINSRVISNFYKKSIEQHFLADKPKSDYIVSVSHGFDQRKNISSALFAFSILKEKYPQLKFMILGYGMEKGGKAFTFAKKNNIMDQLLFGGEKHHNEVIEIIRDARLLLHPSREESFGNVVLEAMVVGTPVVGGDKSGNVPTLLDQGKAGILCDINSPEDMAEKMDGILGDPVRYEKVRQAARKFALANYNEDKIVEEFLDFFREVLNQSKTNNHELPDAVYSRTK